MNQGDVERAVILVTTTMREGSLAYRHYIAETFGIPLRMALLFDGKIRSEIEILSYETGLSTQFLEEFQKAAQNLNIEPAESLSIIVMLTGKLTELAWVGPASLRLSEVLKTSELRSELTRLMKAGDVQTAVEQVLKTMKQENRDLRRYIAQTFGIPESTALVYDELQTLQKGNERQ